MRTLNYFGVLVCLVAVCDLAPAADTKAPADKVLEGANGVKIIVRAQGPYDADVPLQAVCYFKHKKEGDKTLGAAIELDKRLGGVIASLRNRGEFVGDELETLLLTHPKARSSPRPCCSWASGTRRPCRRASWNRSVGRFCGRRPNSV